ncbi:hypothetical protein A5892_00365 [Halotalea alkalilenta]|uniref:Prevent host death protein, Phd antitoxin n=2 Tax=Halotalea alkalilenta TaxID=376489 RepID=A0A172YA39_9GAMM|nr:hypothetical protein A5892_00365 [Halotalea alkalilenta]
MHTLTLAELRTTTHAGGIKGVTLKAEGGAFLIQVSTRRGTDALLAKARSSEPRRFGNPVQALNLLHDLGLVVGEFDVAHWTPTARSSTRVRPDRAIAMKRAHEAAGHDEWFRAEVAKGIAEADDPNAQWVSHEDTNASWAARRAALLERTKGHDH